MRWFLGLSLGYSRLQLAVGRGDGTPFRTVHGEPLDPEKEAGTLQLQTAAAIERLLNRSGIRKGEIAGVGCGFRGPVDTVNGIVRGGPHGHGWDQFPLAHWLTVNFDWPAVVIPDTQAAALAEFTWGAGHGFLPLLYVHAGSQINGALVVASGEAAGEGQPYRGLGAAVDIGHLRPGSAPRYVSYPATTVNALASGVGLVQRATRVITEREKTQELVAENFVATAAPQKLPGGSATSGAVRQPAKASQSDRFSLLLRLAGTDLGRLSAEILAQAASQGDRLSRELLNDAAGVLGWAIAQTVTLFHPARVILGGGLSRLSSEVLIDPLRRVFRNEVSPLLTAWRGQTDAPPGSTARVIPHDLINGTFGDSAALHGALLMAKRAFGHDPGLKAFSAES